MRSDSGRDEPRSSDRTAPPPRRSAPSAAPVDPFFSKPYEASAEAEPAWEKTAAAAAPAPSAGLSRYIKPKRKVGALLGGNK